MRVLEPVMRGWKPGMRMRASDERPKEGDEDSGASRPSIRGRRPVTRMTASGEKANRGKMW